jgi:hypothetical protein
VCALDKYDICTPYLSCFYLHLMIAAAAAAVELQALAIAKPLLRLDDVIGIEAHAPFKSVSQCELERSITHEMLSN